MTRIVHSRRRTMAIAALALAGALHAASARSQVVFPLPGNARALQGRPTVSVETTEQGATRRTLDSREAEASLLNITVDEGRLYWDDTRRPLDVTPAGEFTYLSSAKEPGRYVRVRQINDRLLYVEHVDKGTRRVTYWGELRVLLGN